ncbi:MAG: DUF4215 domain-containing protein [Polyangiaceae bacterium]|nr:DUF4215 domain-containing protein [Polyangiaceae bacterium]
MRARATDLLVVGLMAVWGCGNPVVTREKPGFDNSQAGAEPSEGGSGNEPPPPLLGDGGAAGSGTCEAGSCGLATAGSGPQLLCGNSRLDDGEGCDDGNAVPGDGCDGRCRVESGYECEKPGEKCVSTLSCGDGKPGPNEACDDGNTKSNDGCSSKCQVEEGFQCLEFGEKCEPKSTDEEPECGNGAVEEGESCDDGNTESDDGCSAKCATEDGWICRKAGEDCERDEYCGDGILNGDEECDDGNTRAGDCCNGTCALEPNCTCRTPSTPSNPPHQICSSTVVCGDGKVTGSEACDDGNKDSDDGCSSDCNTVEPGYRCPSDGGPCTVAVETCGNAKLDAGEECDDGQDPMKSGDGCSADCKVEPGYVCPTAGAKCSLIAYCGDGKVSFVRGETCDDGVDPDTDEPADGDGCSASCTVEPFWHCTGEPSECVYTVKCGDKKRTGDETCDDGNTASGDGCDGTTCQVEEGWSCPLVGAACRPICGDGLVLGREQCDDGPGDPAAGDGCGVACQLEPGWVCPEGEACRPTVCGDGEKEGSERCDDGNLRPYDGCAPDCVLEPVCGTTESAVGACSSRCGDGILLASSGEQCDDGNSVSGDGCSSSCQQEQGYHCTSTVDTPPDAVDIPIVYRDFASGWDDEGDPITDTNPDFEEPSVFNGGDLRYELVTGIVESTLDAGRKPVYVGTEAEPIDSTHGPTYFDQWYRDVAGVNQVFFENESIHLVNDGSGSYSMDSRYDAPWVDLGGFYPLDDRGFGNEDRSHNYHFTSELRYWFEYKGGEQLDFSGDDDVFVFVNGHLAIDLGGVHGREAGSVLLDASTGHGAWCQGDGCTPTDDIDFGLELGQIYETVVFQAERHTVASNYWLTLTNFTAGRSTCSPECGDGFVTPDEVCDEGDDNQDGSYGGCNEDCTPGPYCGDGDVDAGYEDCDDGLNTTVYGKSGCAPGCVKPPYCGDGKADTDFGETCDLGADNKAGAYGEGACTNTCQTAPFCGDGFKNGSEQCDEGPDNGTVDSVCDAKCRFTCGNGQLDPGEQCDEGAANNTGEYGGCRSDCTLGPYCGDGVKNGTEQCDDGKNDGSYGTCAPGCKLAPYCGDGDVDSDAGETCDDGEDNGSVDYGDEDACSTRCLPPPYCGDGVVDVAFGEVCDDGDDNGNEPGQCKPDCSGYNKPPITCGNGKLDAGEQCDDGADNGTKSSPCDVRCQLKCGNGFKDPGEECDDGTNDGSYGSCQPDCTLGPYCGDGKKNGPEQCDLGEDNEENPYGKGKCTTQCTLAPYCGDGRLQSKYEACDGQSGCGANCAWII